MIKNYILPVIFFVFSAVFWFISGFIYGTVFFKISLSFLLTGLIFISYQVITDRIAKKVIKNRKTQYTFNKGIPIILVIIFLFAIIQP